jgi:penicillin amidase
MPFGTIEERIPVKGQAPELLTIRTTRHGPVISDLPGRAWTFPGKVFALQASFLVDDDRSVEAQWRASLARDWPSWIDALGPFTAPVQNMTYADRDGNIGFFMPGRVPLRKSGNGVAPVPGWTGDYDWIGWVPFEKLPQAFNPPVGRIATANNKIVPDTYPYLITHDWDDQYRIERIEWGLAKTPKQSIESSTRIQGDVVSLSAKRLVPLMVRAESGDARAKVAIERLANWDCEMAGDRPEPLIYVAWLRSLNKRLFEPRLGPNFKGYWAMTPRATEGVLTRHQHWCGRAGCPAVLRASLADALDELSAKYGEDPNTWRWGRAHQARFAHRIFSRIGFLRRFFDRQVPSDGSADTVNAGAFHFTNTNNPYLNTHGPGLRAIYDLEDLDKSVFLTALGQSGHILSPHYADLLPRWRSFNWLRLPSDAHGETLSLKPKS